MKIFKSTFNFVLLSIFFISLSALADETPDFSSRWFKSEKSVDSTKYGTVETQIYQRYIITETQHFPIATITYLKIPKGPSFKRSINDKILMDLYKHASFTPIRTRQVGNAQVFEGYWKPLNRFTRIYIQEEKNHLIYSIANMRIAYANPTVVETEILQRQMTGAEKIKGSWLDHFTAKLLAMDVAFAQGFPSIPSIPSLPNISVQGNNSLSIPNSVNVNGSFNLNAQIGITGLNGLVTEMGKVNNNFGQLNSSVAGISKSVDKLTGQLGSINNEVSAIHKTFKDNVNPTNLAQLAFVTSASATLGAMATSFAVDGIFTGIKLIYEYLRGPTDAERGDKLKAALAQYESVMAKKLELEKLLDNLLNIKQFAQEQNLNLGSFTEYLTQQMWIYEGMVESYQEQRKDLTQKITKATCPGERSNLQNQIFKLAAECAPIIEQYEKMKHMKERLKNVDGQNLCSMVQSSFQHINEAEAALQDARLAILQNDFIGVKSARENFSSNKDALSEYKSHSGRRYEEAKDNEDQVHSENRKKIDKQYKWNSSEKATAWKEENARHEARIADLEQMKKNEKGTVKDMNLDPKRLVSDTDRTLKIMEQVRNDELCFQKGTNCPSSFSPDLVGQVSSLSREERIQKMCFPADYKPMPKAKIRPLPHREK